MSLTTRYKPDWPQSQERFGRWWRCEPTDRPLLWVDAARGEASAGPRPADPGPPAKYLDADYLIRFARHQLESTHLAGDAFPRVHANLGPGSLALYLGSEPGFVPETVWFKPCIESLETTPLPALDRQNRWLKTHLELIARLRDAFGRDAYTCIPDIVESVDILAAMRDPMRLLYDLVDTPTLCHRWLRRINGMYLPIYDSFYHLVKDEDGSSAFTYPFIWGPGRTAKVQCDFAAMMSPAQFAEFYVPYVAAQIAGLDRSVYHLDGPDAIRHVDLLLGIARLNAIQWVPGAGKPDGGDPCWHGLCEKVLGGGKALQVYMAIASVPAFVKRFGAKGVYIITRAKTPHEADELVATVKTIVMPRR